MEGPRNARLDEFPLVEALANRVFRYGEKDNQTMFEEFPDLYNVHNLENLRVIFADGKLAANINYLPQTISICGCRIRAAALGGVATLEEYRGRGYSTLLLKDCIERMRKQGINILSISGDRSMYRNAGSLPAAFTYFYNVGKGNKLEAIDGSVVVMEYSGEDFDPLVRLYREENTRIIRTYSGFKVLLESNKFIARNTIKRKIIVIKEGVSLSAYIMLVMEDNKAKIVDCGGSKEMIIRSVNTLMEMYGLDSVKGYLMGQESQAIDFCHKNGIELDKARIGHTVKIINFQGFMEALRPYFREIYDSEFVDGLEFSESEKGFCFSYKGSSCIVPEKGKQNDLIFGGVELPAIDFLCNSRFDLFDDFFKKVFPIPFVNTANLNTV